HRARRLWPRRRGRSLARAGPDRAHRPVPRPSTARRRQPLPVRGEADRRRARGCPRDPRRRRPAPHRPRHAPRPRARTAPDHDQHRGPAMSEPYYIDPTVTIHAGDCLDILATLPDASVDAVVTDPPYGLEFMGKAWDSFKGANDWGRLGDTQPWTERPKGGTDPFQGDRPRFHAGAPFQQWCQLWATEC